MLRPVLIAATSLLAFLPATAQDAARATAVADAPGPSTLRLNEASGSADQLMPGIYAGPVRSKGVGYARVTRAAGESLVIAMITAPGVSDDTDLDLKLQLPNGDDCDSATTSTSGSDDATAAQSAVVALESKAAAHGSSYVSDACASATAFVVAVELTAGPVTDVQIAVTREPKVAGPTGASANAAGLAPLLAPDLDPGTRIARGGKDFARAVTLRPASYGTTLEPGVTGFYRVRVGWGQRVGVSIQAPRNGTSFAPAVTTDVGVTLWSPQLVAMNPSSVDQTYDDVNLSAASGQVEHAATNSATVAWANRQADPAISSGMSSDGLHWASAAGWYYVTVTARAGTDSFSTPTTQPGKATAVPARLNVQVSGTASAGPRYVDGSGATIAQPGVDALSTGGAGGGGVPWVRAGLSVVVVLLAGLAVAWALLRRRAT